MNWQPIDTAPQDGTRIVGWNAEEGMAIVSWDGEDWQLEVYGDYAASSRWSPTLWQVAPDPPDHH